MNICYFGDFNPRYIRNSVIVEGLRANGLEVSLCNFSTKNRFLKFIKLTQAYLNSHRKSDFIIVGSSDTSRWLVLLIKAISSKPIFWDAHYSIYDTYVNDRNLIGRKSLKAAYYWFIDWMGCYLADYILLDTNAHIEYFCDLFSADKNKFIRVLVGADKNLLVSMARSGRIMKKDKNIFLVNFHGRYIPLQGVENVVLAAKKLETYQDIKFNLIGSGQTYKEVRRLSSSLDIKNINFIDRVSYEDVAKYIDICDISLGIFGGSEKAKRVIPNKLYEAIALDRPVITEDSLAIREVFENDKNIILCQRESADDLAKKILLIKQNPDLYKTIVANAKELFDKKLMPEFVVGDLINKIKYEK
ncbi:MAG: Glycosyl transferase group 1 [Candidatus Yanofskybacteria bacterium GW2011_GWF1_44_227]|uniref:Glycosyl transferase group 1 n=1 Tax=Candidatus Yanofskybacteria bacterium GW2011_GWE2_40_11 TaxID=1619033 RepID=A0A0G0QTT1_9BACT|nr:MAG: Glycosyl transferase group 1 [Candidatus Moranbacteria bacterium GW2011_GWF2_36_839]KKR37590.1 MAG: Glycosyl transferase group 1 [Candidatus Yanofskybacteria bacterium GW2011_GWE1_40_10]KKR40736.1 MAG: Glycosyl transferase group 1 [Candidatus Yanofskybacteria bacterium GW2011_GWE2_40_11]KKT52735.1 MAG: Glycosyl transferase group 1 [Candidatus Yanofskybacteria bacterium GW2011_GWF1_44_227]OGN36019.1 MAG: hypothetical protein A2207_03100 [Candidatus Yanofskybacteria bacterium RIFOXYA1_FUL